MALPSVPYWGRIDEKGVDSAGYYEPYRCRETFTDAVSKNKERAAFIRNPLSLRNSRSTSVKVHPDGIVGRPAMPLLPLCGFPTLRIARASIRRGIWLTSTTHAEVSDDETRDEDFKPDGSIDSTCINPQASQGAEVHLLIVIASEHVNGPNPVGSCECDAKFDVQKAIAWLNHGALEQQRVCTQVVQPLLARKCDREDSLYRFPASFIEAPVRISE